MKKWTTASDDAADRKAGIKEGSSRDNALDRKRGVPVKKKKAIVIIAPRPDMGAVNMAAKKVAKTSAL